MTDTPPEPKVQPARRALFRGASVVWMIPLAALAVALWVAWQSIADRGPLIQIAFDDASGITAGETELRYRDVAVGIVEDVAFTASLDQVLVSVRMENQVAPFVDDGAEFWVVEPEVTTRGVSGLGTVLSGVYIEGRWDTTPGGFQERFTGLADEPLGEAGRDGLRIMLRASRDHGLNDDTPIVYKGVEVGRVGEAEISEAGTSVIAPAIIYEPHDRLVTTATRFWDTSGFTFSIGPGGAELDFGSIASLVAGGITFNTLVSGGETAEDGAVFEVYPDEALARSSVFEATEGRTIAVASIFESNVAGLASGAPVELRGIRIGEVVNVTGLVDEDRFGDDRVRLLAVMEIRLNRLGLADAQNPNAALEFFDERVEDGLRARLASANILTGGLKVELVETEDTAPAAFDPDAEPFPLIPTVEAQIEDVAATAEGVFQRINALPIEELLESAVVFLDTATSLVGSEDVRQTPAEVRGLLAEARGVIGSDDVQAIPMEVSALLAELQATATQLNRVVATVEEAQAVDRVLAAVDSATAAAEGVTTAIEGVPALVAEIEGLAADVRALPLDPILARVTSLLDEVQQIASSDAVQSLPAEVLAAVAGVEDVVNQARALVASEGVQQAPQELSALLSQARSAVATLDTAVTDFRAEGGVARALAALDAASAAAEEVERAAAGVPSLLSEIEALAAEARALPLQTLVARASDIVATADSVLDTEAVRALPAEVTAAVADLRGLVTSAQATVARLNEEDGVERLLAAVDAAAAAADDVSVAVEGVPSLLSEIEALAAEARALPLQTLVARASDIVATADSVLDTEAVRALPAEVSAAIADLRSLVTSAQSTVAQLNEGEGVERLLAAVDAAAIAADDVSAAVEGVPSLVAEIEAVAAQARTLPLEQLVERTSAILATADELIGSESAAQLPASLNGALAEVEAVLAEIREGGAVQSANAAFASAEEAADAIAVAAAELPGLVAQINTVLAQADTTLSGIDPSSDLSREVRAAIRDVQRAADAVASLARTIERRPNSILLGR
ncbi:PqiB family protein [Tranquillimonas alkanivorans]|uniref:Paraquat-inducible protein B n=1 Tax=Tranquillimonas alkanivorans TaxID=441119 RepID=A0A1I5MCS6_9RHOB|nr:MlaD family protein [Tranquillimonas alkanivorans]SFP07320.1 Paraquat-inducible protein B [Tranquillimonas alkanivorans]